MTELLGIQRESGRCATALCHEVCHMRQAIARRKAAGHGSGVYRRGNVFWLKVRTPASLANQLSRSFWRSSLRTTSRSEALCAARSVRAALDQGFATVGVGMRLGMLTEAQGEAVITVLARRALAEAEVPSQPRRPARRGSDRRRATIASHEAAAWRDVLRRNDLAIVAPLVAQSAATAGLADPDMALVPDLLREAARTLAAVAEENVEREDGCYAGDRSRLLARLAADQPADFPGAKRAGVLFPSTMDHAARPLEVPTSPERATGGGPMTLADRPFLFAGGDAARGRRAAPASSIRRPAPGASQCAAMPRRARSPKRPTLAPRSPKRRWRDRRRWPSSRPGRGNAIPQTDVRKSPSRQAGCAS